MKLKSMTARVIVSLLVVIIACVYGVMKLTDNIQYALVVKTPTSLLFVLLGIMCASSEPSEKPYCKWMLAALIMSFIGDVALVLPGTGFFLLGMAAFGTAQAFFSIAFWKKHKPDKRTLVLFVCLFACTLLYMLLRPGFDFKSILPFCILYALLITFMLSMALTLPAASVCKKQRIAVICGACLFFISDFVLIHEVFLTDPPMVLKLINSLTYFPAQVMLAQSMALYEPVQAPPVCESIGA